MSAKTGRRCAVCGSPRIEEVAKVTNVPVFCNQLHATRRQALEAATADVDLGFCAECGHLFNHAFDPQLVRYAEGYENSLHFSPCFREYASGLAEELAWRYGLDGRTVVEIGCGDGDFLRTLCHTGGACGVGFDPSYACAIEAKETPPPGTRAGDVTVVAETFSAGKVPLDTDLVCCRHVLEHVPDPVSLLAEVRRGIRDWTPIYFEVPNGAHMLRTGGVWDLIYEHCSYFTPSSLIRAVELAGFHVLDVEETFGAQFLGIHARAAGWPARCPWPARVPDELRRWVSAFSDAASRKRLRWELGLEELGRGGRRAVVWGAGSKGVTFLSALARDAIQHAVDVNPRKTGRYVPTGGQEVVLPSQLVELAPDALIVMNPIYTSEIGHAVRELGLTVDILEA